MPRTFAAALLLCLILSAPARAELKPDELVLIVNGNAPNGRQLAEYYAQARGVPVKNIVALKLPLSETIDLRAYELWVAAPMRQWLADNDPAHHVRCLVTFQGVPLKIAERPTTPAEQQELALLKQRAEQVRPKLSAATLRAEAVAQQLDPAFNRPTANGSVEDLTARLAAAGRAIDLKLPAVPPAQRPALLKTLTDLKKAFETPVTADGELDPKPPAAATIDPQQLRQWVNEPDDADARAGVRQAAQFAGLLGYARVLEGQVARLDVTETDACLDSELALLRWPNYDRRRWQVNPLFYAVPAAARAQVPAVLMTARLDGPTQQTVRDLIANSLLTERDGLKGKVVIDSRGMAPGANAYGIYDQTLRNLANLVAGKTKLSLVHDDTNELFRPDVNPQTDVALYCGWYSLKNYIPAFTFARGAVGFHVASFEMTSLRDPGNRGWVMGLLRDGVCATLGPVSEPYLSSFPRADDFFPLLMTGKLPLAEVYWSTNPMASWKQGLIGDPLYTPYKTNPALAVADLPGRMKVIFAGSPSTRANTKEKR